MPPILRALLARTSRRTSGRKAQLTPEVLEGRDLAAVSAVVAPPKALAVPAAVSILFPVFEPAMAVSPGSKAAPAGILFPVFTLGRYTNPRFVTAPPTVAS